MPLYPALTYTTVNLNHLINCLEANKCIDDNRFNNKNQPPHHNLPQTCRGRGGSVCPVWIRPTENFQLHPRTSFRINEHWSNKYNTHKSTINKISLNKELEGNFRSRNSINWSKQVWTPNRNPRHDLPQTLGGRKFVCPVWIRPTDNLQSYPRTSCGFNKRLSDQCEQSRSTLND